MHNISEQSIKKTTPLLNSILSVIASAAAAALCLAIQSEEPTETLFAFFISPFTNSFYLGNLLDRASLILLCAMGFILPAKAGFFNLGGEGQAYLAAFISVEFALLFPNLPQPLGLLTGCTLAALCSGLLGLISASLKRHHRADQHIPSFLRTASAHRLRSQ